MSLLVEACTCNNEQVLSKKAFQKNTFYRFLNSVKTNWIRFTTHLASTIINDDVRDLTDENRVNVFIVDDTLSNRTSCKKTELGSKVFDHTEMNYKKGVCKFCTNPNFPKKKLFVYRKALADRGLFQSL